MHCYACDNEGDFTLDRPTSRYYCSPCFEPTTQVQLAAEAEKDNNGPQFERDPYVIIDTYGLFEEGDEPREPRSYNHDRDYDGYSDEI